MENKKSERNYEFPYEPYDIQIQLMDKIYDSIQNSKVSIIESPTGTGKSLSIICSVLKWIEDNKLGQIETLNKQISTLSLNHKSLNKDSDWVSAQLKQISIQKEINVFHQKLDVINRHITYSKELKQNFKNNSFLNDNIKIINTNKRSSDLLSDITDDEELIVNYLENSDESCGVEKNKTSEKYRPKIFYCSRTHSQLSQFINEIKKTKKSIEYDQSLMLTPLSSRVNYCVNEKVNRFQNVNIINEKCNDLQNTKNKCPMYKQASLEQLKERILSSVQDLEDIVSTGKNLKACPYYASRLSLSDAEIVILPYNIIFHKGTRESFGIDLTDSIVIVDEAHNLLETISNIYSVQIRCGQLQIIMELVTKYLTKYYSRFNPTNLMYLKQLISILKNMINLMQQSKSNGTIDTLDFVLKLELGHINIYRLIKFIEDSHIASKLYMFSNQVQSLDKDEQKKTKISGTKAFLNKFKKIPSLVEEENVEQKLKKKTPENISVPNKVNTIDKTQEESFNSNMVYTFKEFLLALKDYSISGKILITVDQSNSSETTLKYILLNASSHFKDILTECRSVILCGGTMKPFEDYIQQLFKPLGIPDERILTFSCDHVIEKDNLIAIGCRNGPNNLELNYTFSNRSSTRMIKETGQTILEYCQVIPKGIVLFFPSYDYVEFVLKQWETMGILDQIAKCKRVFKEPKKSSLTSMMSEGINFSDDLGRGVIVIGLPYANKSSPDLREKMSYFESISTNLANEYYENLCMRAVNQSIGRSIRHKNDYAAIILLDSRYCTKTNVKNKLSDWIKSRYITCDKFSIAISQTKSFFERKIQI
ncbi:hypothetical protein RDWZM_000732 [Blomia tropicalis]|uniref:Helicase ATP-binding domain-containing protein n=1 Tax=Blomia tropicalis TaxID=40697 RepID=A0A9Q0MAX4_BLOTA|nr:hypothetical protein RDWZM_000732 [Blomia tropicalis]